MYIEMAGNRRVMTYDNLTGVPATSSLVRLIVLFLCPCRYIGCTQDAGGSAFYWCRVTGASLEQQRFAAAGHRAAP